MKRILICLAFALCLCVNTFAQGPSQVIDLRTGVVNNSGVPGTLIPYQNNDDTWFVCWPGNYPAGPYNPVQCGNGYFAWWMTPTTSYWPLDPTVRWLSPHVVTATGEHDGSPGGYYYYRMTFQYDTTCPADSGVFEFSRIGADDYIDQIILNTTTTAVSYSYNPLSSNVSFSVPGSALVQGTNEVFVRVFNWSDATFPWTHTGLEINGYLTLYSSQAANPAFSYTTPNSSTLNITSVGSGTHSWEIYSSPNGNPGTYYLVGTYSTPNVNLTGHGPCYIIKHQVTTVCGTACSNQSICYRDCDDVPHCEVPPPTGLRFAFNTFPLSFTWNPVPGAISYILEITYNDPTCCAGNGGRPVTVTIPVANNYYSEIDELPCCFSWRVKAVCENGTVSYPSAKKCENCQGFPPGGGGDPHGSSGQTGDNGSGTAGKIQLDKNFNALKVFPNPAKGSVTIDLETERDVEYTAEVFDVNGKLVKTFDKGKTVNRKSAIKWNTETLSKGVYLVKITTSDKKEISKKLVIE